MNRIQRFLIPAIPFLLLTGCGDAGSPGAGLDEATIDTLPSGVIEVTNHGPTAWTGSVGWHFKEIATIDPPAGSSGELSDVLAVVSDSVGNIYALQSKPTTIKVFGPDGRWRYNIGREGDGPGEFRDGMLGLIGDTLVVQDPNNSRITTFLTDGTFIGTHHSRCCYWTSSTLPAFANGTVAIAGPPSDSTSGAGALYMTHMDGTVVDTVPLPDRQEDDDDNWTVTLTSGKSRSMMSMSIPGHPRDMGAWRPDGMLVSGNTGSYTLVVGHGYADTVRIIHADAPQLSFTDAARDSLYDNAIAAIGDQWREEVKKQASRSDIPTERPIWTNLTVDPENRIWVALPDSAREIASFDVFSPEGILLGRVAAQQGVVVNGYWVGDRVVATDHDDVGLPIIRTYRLVRPTETAGR